MKQSIRAASAPIVARVTIPGSKSITNRALLLAALAEGDSILHDMLLSDDTAVFVKALQQLGISIQVDPATRSCRIIGGQGKFPHSRANIGCADAGTAARFLLAACAAVPGVYVFDGSPRLRERPLAPLLKVLCDQGATVVPEGAKKMPFTLSGADGLRGGRIEIEGTETSQFFSALLMIAPLAKLPVVVTAKEMVSRPYIEMTCSMMADFGVKVQQLDDASYSVSVPQCYQGCEYVIEPDLSTASYFFAAAAVTGGAVTIQAVDRMKCKQGDIAFLTVLEKMGCDVMESATGLTVKTPKVLQGVVVNMQDFSDTFMTLAAIAPFAKTPTTITGIAHTRLQESDRITAMRKGLEQLQIKVEEGPDSITIYPGSPKAGVIDSHNDHRIAMAFSIIGLRVSGIEIDGAECVAKTCPAFFDLWSDLAKSR